MDPNEIFPPFPCRGIIVTSTNEIHIKKETIDKGESFVLLQTIPQILEQKWIILVRQKNSLVTAL